MHLIVVKNIFDKDNHIVTMIGRPNDCCINVFFIKTEVHVCLIILIVVKKRIFYKDNHIVTMIAV